MARFRSLQDPETVAEFVRRVREGIYITDARGRILDANPAFLGMLGISSLKELRGVTARKLFVDPERRRRELEILDREGTVHEFEFDIRRPDGRIRTLLDTCYAVDDPESGETLFHGILIDITERKQLEHRLREQGIRDPLTGCFNRRFLPELERRALEDRGLWGTAVIDVDYFKQYNDRYGHKAGDEVLVQVSAFLRSLVRDQDAVVRTGGDEFVVVVLGKEPWPTRSTLQRIESDIEGRSPVPLTVASAVREEGETLEQTIIRADQKLLQLRNETRRPPYAGQG